MPLLTYDVPLSLSRSTRAAFTRAYGLSLIAFALAVAAAMLIGG